MKTVGGMRNILFSLIGLLWLSSGILRSFLPSIRGYCIWMYGIIMRLRAILCHCIWMPGIIEQSINHVAVPTQSCCNTSVRLEKDLLIWVYISRYIFFHSDKSPSNRWTLVKYLAISFAYSVDTRVVGLNLGPNGIRFGEGAAAKNCTLRWKGRNPKSC